MSRLTAEEQKEYEEEAEYAEQHGNIRQKGAPSTYERIRGAVSSGAKAVKDAANSPAMRDWAERSNRTEGLGGGSGGLGGYNPPAAMQRVQRPRAGVEVNQGSIVHPGNRLYVIEGSMLASGGGQKPQERQRKRPPWHQGGLGDEDRGL